MRKIFIEFFFTERNLYLNHALLYAGGHKEMSSILADQ